MNIENLYRQVIMEHYKYPKNKGLVSDENYLLIHLHNPSCGDDVKIQLLVEDNEIKDIRHEGVGCSICCSSASVASEMLINKEIQDAQKIINEYYSMLTGKNYNKEILQGDAIAYQGVSKFPARIRCATLAWKAIEKGLEEEQEV